MEMRKSSHGHGARPRNPGATKKHQKGNKKSGKLQDPGANRSGADNGMGYAYGIFYHLSYNLTSDVMKQ